MLDSNDHSPVFSAPVYRVSVPEGAAPGTPIVTLLCRDKDHLGDSLSTSPLRGQDLMEDSLQDELEDSQSSSPLMLKDEEENVIGSKDTVRKFTGN